MKKRLFSILLALTLCLSLLPTAALAASTTSCEGGDSCTHEAAIGTTHYDTLAEALKAASSGDTITLLKAVTDNHAFLPGNLDDYTYDKEVYKYPNYMPTKTTIDSLTLTGATGASLAGGWICDTKNYEKVKKEYLTYSYDIGTLTFKDMTMTDRLYIYDTGPGSVEIDSLVFEDVTFDMENALAANKTGAVHIISSEGNINNVTFKHCTFKNCSDVNKPIAIDCRTTDDINITIENCSFDAANYNAIQIAGTNSNYSGTIKITGNTISNTVNCGIVLSVVSGDLTITDNTMTNAANGDGVAIGIVGCADGCTVSDVSGNTLNGDALVFTNYDDGSWSTVVDSGLTSGTYLSRPSVAPGYIANQNADGTWTVSRKPIPSKPLHDVDVKSSLNGSVSVNQEDAREGTVVTVTVDPATGYALDELTVTDKNGNAIAVTSLGGGKYSFIMPDGAVTVRASFTDGQNTGFVDVPVSKYFYNAVNWAVANGITSGVDSTHFAPYASCTRGQLVTFLWRAAGQPAAKATENAFGDVKETSSFYKAILWAAENGIVTGYSDGTFRPNASVTRQQTAAILYRYAKVAGMDVSVGEDTNILSFNDALSVSEYAISAFRWATGAQVITGNAGNLLPYDTCTRAQIVTMLYRLLAK